MPLAKPVLLVETTRFGDGDPFLVGPYWQTTRLTATSYIHIWRHLQAHRPTRTSETKKKLTCKSYRTYKPISIEGLRASKGPADFRNKKEHVPLRTKTLVLLGLSWGLNQGKLGIHHGKPGIEHDYCLGECLSRVSVTLHGLSVGRWRTNRRSVQPPDLTGGRFGRSQFVIPVTL